MFNTKTVKIVKKVKAIPLSKLQCFNEMQHNLQTISLSGYEPRPEKIIPQGF